MLRKCRGCPSTGSENGAVAGVDVGLPSRPDHEELDIDTNTGTDVDAWICSASFSCARS